MDALTLKAEVFELQERLKNARIEKIYQPSPFELVLKTSSGMLLISTHPTHFTINITDRKFENPSAPGAFTMLLRKHIAKGFITGVSMDGFERVVTVFVQSTNEMFETVSFKLIAELMGKHSNIVLVDGNNKIIDSIKRVPFSTSRVRQLLPGLAYEAPPKKADIPQSLGRDYSSFSGLNRFTKEQLDNGNLTLEQCISSIERPTPNIVQINGKPKLVLSVVAKGVSCVQYATMSEALDSFYFTKDASVQNADLIHIVTTFLKRLTNSREIHNKSLKANEDKYRLYGELITGNAYKLKQGDKSARVTNYYTNEEVEIPLDETLTPHQNAQKYYRRYNKLKSAKIHASKQLEIINEQQEYLENILTFLKNASSQKEVDAIKDELRAEGFIKKSKKKSQTGKLEPMTYITSDGFTVRVGRNSFQNDELTTKKAKATDIWCHTKDIPGSHVIISADNKEITDKAITEGCTLAAYHSKGRNSSNVQVDYTFVRHVKKPAHALPGKVIYTNQKTVFVTPVQKELPKQIK